MKENQLKELLEKEIADYINNIDLELENSHDQWFDNFGFPIFGETSKDYHEQVYFQSYLESYTRKMINHILRDIFEEELFDKFIWPEFKYTGVYNGYTNIEYEKEFGFEFIDIDKKIGYRYTDFQYNEIEDLLTKGNVNSIVLIVWNNKDEIIGFDYDDERVEVILLWDLFRDMFNGLNEEEIENMYNQFIKGISEAVNQANCKISLTTVPGFTSSYLFKTKGRTISDLQRNVKKLSFFSVNNENYKTTEEQSKQLIEKYKLSEYFLINKMEYAFVGSSYFAKSYLTSEYLYHYFKGTSKN